MAGDYIPARHRRAPPSHWGKEAAVSLLPEGAPRRSEIRVDRAVLAFGLASAMVASLFVLAPILHSRLQNLHGALEEGKRLPARPPAHLRRGAAAEGLPRRQGDHPVPAADPRPVARVARRGARFDDVRAASRAADQRTRGEPSSFAGAARAAIAELDPQLAVARLQTLDAVVYDAVAKPRFITVLMGFLAFVALLLAAVGIDGVMS